jgi:TonB family protein
MQSLIRVKDVMSKSIPMICILSLLLASQSAVQADPLPASIQKQGYTGKANAEVNFTAWQTLEPKWRINPKIVNTLTYSLDNTPIKGNPHQAVYAQYLNQALEDWSKASRGSLHFVKVSDPAMAQIRFDWVKSHHPGQTIYTTDTEGYITQAGVFVTPKKLPASLIRTLTLREVGSALGLKRTQNLDDAMCAMETRDDVPCIQIQQSQNDKRSYLPTLTPSDSLYLKRLYKLSWQEDAPQNHQRVQKTTDPLLKSEIWNKHKYLSTMSEDIRNHWAPGPYRNLPVTIAMTLDPYGRLLNAEITQSSHSQLADNLALRAIQEAAPYAPFPQDYSGQLLKVNFHFKP